MLSFDDPTEEVIVLKGAQLGFTTAILESFILYNIASSPNAQLFVTASKILAKKQAEKIDRMINLSGFSHLISSQRGGKKDRHSGSTEQSKEYKGGFLHIIGANSASDFRSNAYPIVICDEADAYPLNIKGEGNVFSLIKNRTNSYSGRKKILLSSTPKVEQSSLVYERYRNGDQQKYFVPCKHCGGMQELVWHKTEDDKTYGIIFEVTEDFVPIS